MNKLAWGLLLAPGEKAADFGGSPLPSPLGKRRRDGVGFERMDPLRPYLTLLTGGWLMRSINLAKGALAKLLSPMGLRRMLPPPLREHE